MEGYDSLFCKYDHLYSRMVHLRLIAYGAFMVLESCSPEVYMLFKEQNRDDLLEEFKDIGNAIVWMRDELKKPVPADGIVAPMEIPI